MPAPGSAPGAGPPSPANSGAWLGSQSVFDRRDERKLGRAFGTSLAIHAGVLALILLGLYEPATQLLQQQDPVKVVYLEQPGPGGGGGGSPAPAPPKPMEIPHHPLPKPEPVPVPTPVPPPTPIPVLNAPVETNVADMLKATGVSSVSLAMYGGGGQGTGLGSGKGNGVGPGEGGGFGGGAFRPGSGITNPSLIKQAEPKYTSEAMRAKIQGDVYLDVVVQPNGTVGQVQVTKSLDDKFGLDQEAIKAAKQWLFRPGTDRDGKPVPVIVTLILSFRLH
jgi:periplasmic protein TonB